VIFEHDYLRRPVYSSLDYYNVLVKHRNKGLQTIFEQLDRFFIVSPNDLI